MKTFISLNHCAVVHAQLIKNIKEIEWISRKIQFLPVHAVWIASMQLNAVIFGDFGTKFENVAPPACLVKYLFYWGLLGMLTSLIS